MKVDCGRLDRNHHGTEAHGQPWNKQTVCGPRFKLVRLEGFDSDSRLKANIGWRVIFYFPSGAWWHLDICWPPPTKNEDLHEGI
jgi:hypothetical protein